MPSGAIAKFVKDAVTIGLLHLGMNVVTRVAEFRNLFGQQFHAVDRVAKDNALINLELGKERVEAVDLLSFFDVRVELRNTSQREFVHEIDTVGVGDKLLAKGLDRDGKGSAEQADLMFLVAFVDDLFQDGLGFRREKLVRFVHDNGFDMTQVGNLFGGQIEDAARSRHDNVNRVVEPHDIILQGCSSGGDHALHSHVLAHFLDNGRCLQSQFSRGDQDEHCNIVNQDEQAKPEVRNRENTKIAHDFSKELPLLTLNLFLIRVGLFEAGNNVRRRLSGSVLGSGQDISILQDNRDGFLLNRRWPLKSLFENSHEEFSLEEKVFKFSSLGVGDILGLVSGVFLGLDETILVGPSPLDGTLLVVATAVLL